MRVRLEVLAKEHQRVRLNVWALGIALNELGSEKAMRTIVDVATFIERGMLPHFEIEEKFVFRMAILVGEKEEIVWELLAEHAFLRERFSHFLELVAKRQLSEEFVEASRAIINNLPAHVEKEDRELFPVVREAFGNQWRDHPPPTAYSEY